MTPIRPNVWYNIFHYIEKGMAHMNIQELNDAQQEAVRHTDGPLLVIAGAGSGKTRVLTYRIAYLIENKGVDPYNILAITFTNKAANEMKERVSAVTESGHMVWVSTFHSMCVRILRRFADRLGFTNDFTIYDSDDAKSLMREIFKRRNINTKYYKEKTVLNAISEAKDAMREPKDLLAMATDQDLKAKTIAELYSEYQSELKKNNAMDFDDLIFMTVRLFNQDPDALEVFANRFHYIMVDEYQDTNTSQFILVSKLAKKWKNLCVVGDDDQSIYKFRGANIENILNFEKAFSGAEVIKLEQNYRSTKNILNAANAVIKHNSIRKDKTLWTANEEGEKISLLLFDNAYNEADGIANGISSMVRDGWNYSDLAILYRTNAQSRLLEEKLVTKNIPYKIYGGVNFYQRREIKDILAYLKVILNDSDGQALKRIINVPKRGIGQTTIDRVQFYADIEGITFWEALKRGSAITNIGAAYKKTDAFVDLIEGFRRDEGNMSLEGLTCKLLDEIGYVDMLAETSTPEELADRQDNIDEFINKIVSFESSNDYEEDAEGVVELEGEDFERPSRGLRGFIEEVSLVADSGAADEYTDFVSLMTLHSAKGLEFPIVYMAGMEDGLFPSYMSIVAAENNGDELEEERRLAYVGITRARKKLFMTYAKERMVRGERQASALSRFAKEVPFDYIEKENRSVIGDDFGFDEHGNEKRKGSTFNFGSSYGPDGTYEGIGSGVGKLGGSGSYEAKNSAKFNFRKMGMAAGAAYASVNTPATAPRKRLSSKRETIPQKEKSTIAKPSNSFGTFQKPKTSEFSVGDRVENERFGQGIITNVEDMGRDWLLTVNFDEMGVKKMFAGFINLKKIQ